jgi:Bacterial toxin 23
MLRSTTFWTADGETNQRVGAVHFLFNSGGKQGSVSYENDGNPFGDLGLGDNNDGFRTASVNMRFGDYEAGFNLFTGYRDVSLPGKPKAGYPYGIVPNPEADKYRAGIAYFGYKGWRAGWNNERIRHAIQNQVAHKVFVPQPWFDVLPNAYNGFYGGYGKGSRYHNW